MLCINRGVTISLTNYPSIIKSATQGRPIKVPIATVKDFDSLGVAEPFHGSTKTIDGCWEARGAIGYDLHLREDEEIKWV
ncbi:hypothetical protein H6P81_012866 [Aristolochia fimbriata]|uniref:Uncharacterized protein n=1 Tax=Aristolochia fimbriata TaxID=158543 RepID=A0AAV7ED32_ARIFI|nr:hypothetical protein H6P81_012866 [Aristolochia fimbriata]